MEPGFDSRWGNKCQLGYGSQAVSKTVGGSSILPAGANEHVANIGKGLRLQNVINVGSIPSVLSNGK